MPRNELQAHVAPTQVFFFFSFFKGAIRRARSSFSFLKNEALHDETSSHSTKEQIIRLVCLLDDMLCVSGERDFYEGVSSPFRLPSDSMVDTCRKLNFRFAKPMGRDSVRNARIKLSQLHTC